MTEQKTTTRDLADAQGTHDSITEERARRERPAGETSAPAGNPPRAQEAGPAPPSPSRRPAVAGEASASDDSSSTSTAAKHERLLPHDQSVRFSEHWQEIQASFVDEPRDSVAQADALVADLMQRLAAGFSKERERLEEQWEGGGDVSTEDLRLVFTRYRSFFDRLLSA